MQPLLKNQVIISDSRFHMWRAMITLIHADGRVDQKEKNWVSQCLSRLVLSESQAQQLREDFLAPIELEILLPKITDLKDFSNLLHLGNVLLNIDGQMSDLEKLAFQQINDFFGAKFNSNSRLELARSIVSADNDSLKWRLQNFVQGWGQASTTSIFGRRRYIPSGKALIGLILFYMISCSYHSYKVSHRARAAAVQSHSAEEGK